jgi:transposase
MLSPAQNLPEDPALLKAIIADLQAENAKLAATVRAHDLVVQALRLRIAKLKKQAFGKSSEKIEREIEQLELALEDILVAAAQTAALPSDAEEDETTAHVDSARSMARRPRVASDTPRERRTRPGQRLSRLRGRITPRRRERERNPRDDHSQAEGDRGGAAEEVLPLL